MPPTSLEDAYPGDQHLFQTCRFLSKTNRKQVMLHPLDKTTRGCSQNDPSDPAPDFKAGDLLQGVSDSSF